MHIRRGIQENRRRVHEMPNMLWQTDTSHEIVHEEKRRNTMAKKEGWMGDMMFGYGRKLKFTMKESYKKREEAERTAKQFRENMNMDAIVVKTNRVEGYPYEIIFNYVKLGKVI